MLPVQTSPALQEGRVQVRLFPAPCGLEIFQGRIITGLGIRAWGSDQPAPKDRMVFTSLLGHIRQRQVLFIVPDSEGDSRSHHTAKEEVCYTFPT